MTYKEKLIQGNVSKHRLITPKGIVLHHTGDYAVSSIVNTFCNPKSNASAHVLILKDGERIVFAKDNERTWHSGVSEFKGFKNCNNFMLGVEFHGDTNKERLTCEQIESFVEWAEPRILKYKIAMDWITTHSIISPGRKKDICNNEFLRLQFKLSDIYDKI